MDVHYADNLPVYLKALSRFLWFVPTGISERSLPYIEQAIRDGEYYKDVAKYAYVDLLVNQNKAGTERAKILLSQLIRDYPQNPRIHFRLIELLLGQGLYEQTLATGNNFLRGIDQYQYDPVDVALVKLWITRAHLALNNIELAQRTFNQIDHTPGISDSFPRWSTSWHLLTRAQLLDLQDRRTKAMQGYEQIVSLRKTHYIHPRVVLAAQQGIKSPYVSIPGSRSAF